MILPLEALKKIGAALEDGAYTQLIDYSAAKSEGMKSRFSVSGSVGEPTMNSLAELPVHEETSVVKR